MKEENKNKKISIRITSDQYKELNKLSERNNIKIGQVVRDAIFYYTKIYKC